MDNIDIVYRAAEESDIDVIYRLVKAAIAEMDKNGISQWDSVYPAREDFLEDIRKGQLRTGMVCGKTAVVYAVNKECDEQYHNGSWAYPDSEYRVIHRLCVDPQFQHRGIAKAALEHIEDELRREGVESIRLDVFTENPHALSLYRKNGYQSVGEAHWRKGRFLLMEKKL